MVFVERYVFARLEQLRMASERILAKELQTSLNLSSRNKYVAATKSH
jgi:hypothetical protein